MLLVQRNRSDWGTYNKQYDPSDLIVPHTQRNIGFILKYDKTPSTYKSIDETQPQTIAGSGFIDTLKEKIKNLPKYLSKASDLYSSDTGTALRNMIPSYDENAKPGFSGEKHAVLKLPNGKNGVANYMGPGTNVTARLRRGDMGRTKSDSVAKRHDIDYMLAQGEKSKSAQLTKIREADNRMIKSLQKIREDKSDAPRNIQMGMRLIQAKKLGEDFGVLDKSKFSGDLLNIAKDDLVFIEKERNKSQQAGYGDDGKLLPGQKLKMALLKSKVTGPKKPRTNPSMDSYLAGSGAGSYPSASKGLQGQKKGHILRGKPIEGKGLRLAGRGKKTLCSMGKGIGLAGGQIDIASKIKSDIIPEILKFIKTKIPDTEVGNIVNKYLGDIKDEQSLKKGIFAMARELVPLMMMYKLKQSKLNPVILEKLGIFKKAMQSSGMKGRGMKGRGIIDSIRALMGSAESKIDDMLAKAIWSYVSKMFLNSRTKGSGMLKGGDFWSDFADGFKTGFVKTLEIIAMPIKLLAPEFEPAVEIGKTIGKALPRKMLF